jgi:hypothetical protein
MIGMLKRQEIEILLKAGHSQSEVVRLSGVGLRSVRRIAKEPSVDVDDAADRKKRRIGRPNVLENFRQQVEAILKQEADLPSLEILRRMREAGYSEGKTVLYELVASLRSQMAQIWTGTWPPGLNGSFAPLLIRKREYSDFSGHLASVPRVRLSESITAL